MSLSLLPCPFCGGEPEQFEDKWMNYYWIGCKDDDCPATARGVKLKEERDAAIERWNKRVDLN